MKQTERATTSQPITDPHADRPRDPTELTDSDLERVVGGLARTWIEHEAARLEPGVTRPRP